MKRKEQEVIDSLTPDDLQENHRAIADAVGMDGLKLLCEAFGGSSIYIPQFKELAKNRVYRCIHEEYRGDNIKELAIKYEVSESTVYNIVRDKIVKGNMKKILPGQINIADLQL
ncbi:MAG: hypothetical protein K2I96_12190 [Lachnospiraceae bacterium]|nr:hypothetical protein [Lachnospiraceae bacterium]